MYDVGAVSEHAPRYHSYPSVLDASQKLKFPGLRDAVRWNLDAIRDCTVTIDGKEQETRLLFRKAREAKLSLVSVQKRDKRATLSKKTKRLKLSIFPWAAALDTSVETREFPTGSSGLGPGNSSPAVGREDGLPLVASLFSEAGELITFHGYRSAMALSRDFDKRTVERWCASARASGGGFQEAADIYWEQGEPQTHSLMLINPALLICRQGMGEDSTLLRSETSQDRKERLEGLLRTILHSNKEERIKAIRLKRPLKWMTDAILSADTAASFGPPVLTSQRETYEPPYFVEQSPVVASTEEDKGGHNTSDFDFDEEPQPSFFEEIYRTPSPSETFYQ